MKSGFSRELSSRELLAREVYDAPVRTQGLDIAEVHIVARRDRVVMSCKLSSGEWVDGESAWERLSRWVSDDGTIERRVDELLSRIKRCEPIGVKFGLSLPGGPRVMV